MNKKVKLYLSISLFLCVACLPLVHAMDSELPEPIEISNLPASSIVVFGELHGTNEIPAFFADQVQELLESGRTVHVGLEFSAADTPMLLKAMQLPEIEANRALLQLKQWNNGNDGRTSVAMARLIHRLGKLEGSYSGQLKVFNYDIDAGWSGTPNERDESMAKIIGQHRANSDPDQYVVVLAGNVHAFGVAGARWDPNFESMAARLKRVYDVITLRNVQSGGTAWICTPECGPSKVRGNFEASRPAIYIKPFEMDWADEPVYDGVFFVGELSASEPLHRALRMADPTSKATDPAP